MSGPDLRYRPWIHFYAIGLSVLTFLLLFAGGMVTSTNSGLAVPDWPTTFGQNMFTFPPSMMKGGIFYEHGHRLFASLVGLLTIGICAIFWFKECRRWLKWTGTLALLLVIAQGVLGGVTVLYKLPMPVSVSHACTAELFFALTVFMAFATSRSWMASRPSGFRLSTPGQIVALVFVGITFLQILVGAVMRHSYAGLAIPTFPLAFGEWVPPFWNFGISVHFLHSRVGATLLVVFGAALIGRVLASGHARPVKGMAILLGAALLFQCLLGMFAIWSGKSPVPTTFHLVGGAFVWAGGVLLCLMIYRLGADVPERSPGASRSPAFARPLGREGVAVP
jgi:cytochrome c oxidase assembly protein subunit 15